MHTEKVSGCLARPRHNGGWQQPWPAPYDWPFCPLSTLSVDCACSRPTPCTKLPPASLTGSRALFRPQPTTILCHKMPRSSPVPIPCCPVETTATGITAPPTAPPPPSGATACVLTSGPTALLYAAASTASATGTSSRGRSAWR